ncbi:helicase-exonuclease AddAB subunit AddB [Marinicrinis sediminis]|uniref:ATP-dependent helicase/deoxyribonuclease subunit B n=1 Tax=Marinicrinis sediminis TaxID=1652465 RepID=A0ABW5RCS4_9BACL
MTVQLIAGRAGSGKTYTVLTEITEKLKDKPLGSPLIYLVPEQASFQGELALTARMGLQGMARAQVLSFRRLAYRVMQETGGIAQPPIDDLGKTMLLHYVMKQHEQELVHLRTSSEQMGLLEQTLELFDECKRYAVKPDRLHALLDKLNQSSDITRRQDAGFARKLQDLALIMEKYESLLVSSYLDGDEALNRLTEQVGDSAYLQEAEIWIDGFHGFTPQEYAVLLALMQTCRCVTITLCTDKRYESEAQLHELDLFHPTAVTMLRLKQMMQEHGIAEKPIRFLSDPGTVPPRFRDEPLLAHLEAHYDARKPYQGQALLGADQIGEQKLPIQIYAAANPKAEAEAVAREMVRLAREEGMRWQDMTVLSRNLAHDEDLLTDALDKYDIPYFLDQTRSVMQHPVIELILSALEVIQRNWKYEAVFRCVKTDFLLPLNRHEYEQLAAEEPSSTGQQAWFASFEDKEAGSENLDSDSWELMARRGMDELENYVLAFGIQGSRWLDDDPWRFRYRMSAISDESDEKEQDEAERKFLSRIHRYREQVRLPLLALQKRMKRAKTAQAQVHALYVFLEEVQVQARLERWSHQAAEQGMPEKAREHLQVWNSVIDVMDQMVEVLGAEEMTLEWFSQLLTTGLESMKLALVPPALDQVTLGSFDRTRPGEVQAVFIIGANDGVLPAKLTEDGMISEQEREWLLEQGVELAPTSKRRLLDEQFLIYTALTVPSRCLYMSYPFADGEGKSLLPSEVIRRLQRMFPMVETQLKVQEPDMNETLHQLLSFLSSPDSAMSFLVVQLRRWMRGEEIHDLWWDVYNWYASDPQWQERLRQKMIGLFYANQEKPLARETSRKLYGKRLRASVSRMERFASCPFAHFASYGLKLKERKVYRLEAPDIGELFHAALTYIAVDLQKREIEWGQLTTAQCYEEAVKAVEHLSPKLQSEILLSSKRYHFISKKLKEIVGKASAVLGEQARRGSFSPVGMEIGFGPNQALPPLVFDLENGGQVELLGRIDRVDMAQGDGKLLLRVIDYKSSSRSLLLPEVYYGLSLQLLTYLDVVVTHAQQWLGQEADPAGVLYFHVHHPMLQKQNGLNADEARTEIFKRFKMKGLVLSDLEVVQKMDQQLDKGHSDMLPVAVKADGAFYKSSSVFSLDQWEQVRSYIRGQIKEMGERILDGEVGIEPIKFGKKTPCQFCPYHAVCQFDPLFEQNDYRSLYGLQREEVWAKVQLDPSEGEAGDR